MRRGFSLIELLIAVTIIGLLASIALPAYGDIQRRAFNTVAKSDLSSAIHFIEVYITENNGALPDQDDLMEETEFELSPGVVLEKYDVKDEGAPDQRIHMHIYHVNSPHYYHTEYPTDPEFNQKWRK